MELHEYFEEVMSRQAPEETADVTEALQQEIDRLQPILDFWTVDAAEKQEIIARCCLLNETTKSLGYLSFCSLVIPTKLIPLSMQVEGLFSGQFIADEIQEIDDWGQDRKMAGTNPYLVIGTTAQGYQTPKWYNFYKSTINEQTLNLAEALTWLARQDHYTLSHTRDYLVKANGKLIRIRRSAERIKIFHPQRKQPRNSYPQFLLTCNKRASASHHF